MPSIGTTEPLVPEPDGAELVAVGAGAGARVHASHLWGEPGGSSSCARMVLDLR